MGRHYQEFLDHNFEVILILGELVDKAKKYAESLHLPFPILADPTRGVYQQYGLNKTLFIQRTASVIIDCNGVIRYSKSVTNPIPWLQEIHDVLDFVKSMEVVC